MTVETEIKKKKLNLTKSIDSVIIEEVLEEKKNNDLDSLGRVYATGRRKESAARLWFSLGDGVNVNYKKINEYFPQEILCENVTLPFKLLGIKGKIFATVSGGGKASQSDALRLALSKALLIFDPSFKAILKEHGLLTSDGRQKEREHYGFRTSRKPQQYCRR